MHEELDSGPFDKPFENLRVLSGSASSPPRAKSRGNVEGLRVPSLSRDFRRNDGKSVFKLSKNLPLEPEEVPAIYNPNIEGRAKPERKGQNRLTFLHLFL
jgi:hypothetical protein